MDDCSSESTASQWLPQNIFIVGSEDKVSAPFRHFNELYTLAESIDDDTLLSVCRSISVRDPLILLYTSGTLGSPKGVLRTTASFFSKANDESTPGKKESLIAKISDMLAQRFSLMNLLPLYHLGGFQTMLTNLKDCNIRIVMLGYFNPLKALCVLEKERCQILVGTSFMIQRILSLPQLCQFNLSSLLGVIFTSAAVNKSVLQQMNRCWKLYFFLVSYGSTEAGAVSNGFCLMERKSLIFSIFLKILTKMNFLSGLISFKDFEKSSYSLAGKVDKSVEVSIIDPVTEEPLPLYAHGEIAIRSHRVMKYYRDNQDRTRYTRDGWYKSGDLGYIDEKGYLTVIERIHRTVSRGGEKISPVEVENILLKHNDVAEAFVHGIPDDMYGEELCACVVAKNGRYLTAEGLRAFLDTYLSAFKIPRYFVFLPCLPLSPTGKIIVDEVQTLAFQNIGVTEGNE
jgi:fatty-acyl-CoA synthase